METFFALLALCEGMHRSPVNSPHKSQWRGALGISLIYAWTNVEQTIETLVIWDAITLIMTSVWWFRRNDLKCFSRSHHATRSRGAAWKMAQGPEYSENTMPWTYDLFPTVGVVRMWESCSGGACAYWISFYKSTYFASKNLWRITEVSKTTLNVTRYTHNETVVTFS